LASPAQPDACLLPSASSCRAAGGGREEEALPSEEGEEEEVRAEEARKMVQEVKGFRQLLPIAPH